LKEGEKEREIVAVDEKQTNPTPSYTMLRFLGITSFRSRGFRTKLKGESNLKTSSVALQGRTRERRGHDLVPLQLENFLEQMR